MRICTKCKKSQPNKEFFVLARTTKADRKRYKSWCRLCENARLRKKNKQIRKRNRAFLDNYKRTHKCLICPENDHSCLEFHHVNEKKGKTDRAAMWAQKSYSIKRLKEMCEECALICANCHRKVHYAVDMVVLAANLKRIYGISYR